MELIRENQISSSQVADLLKLAQNSPIKRARACLHGSDSELLHVMLIVALKESDIPIHRHGNRDEYYVVLDGKLELSLYDEVLSVKEEKSLNPYGSPGVFTNFVRTNEWHQIKILSEFAVFLEITQGPFRREATDFPT